MTAEKLLLVISRNSQHLRIDALSHPDVGCSFSAAMSRFCSWYSQNWMRVLNSKGWVRRRAIQFTAPMGGDVERVVEGTKFLKDPRTILSPHIMATLKNTIFRFRPVRSLFLVPVPHQHHGSRALASRPPSGHFSYADHTKSYAETAGDILGRFSVQDHRCAR